MYIVENMILSNFCSIMRMLLKCLWMFSRYTRSKIDPFWPLKSLITIFSQNNLNKTLKKETLAMTDLPRYPFVKYILFNMQSVCTVSTSNLVWVFRLPGKPPSKPWTLTSMSWGSVPWQPATRPSSSRWSRNSREWADRKWTGSGFGGGHHCCLSVLLSVFLVKHWSK